ncbi:hypothetical protein BpHYR1_014315 [Brachionus plicatilis]|uniref:Uncharacterized protein n=1 Tax=Brachionus plicatilis TaxID=10195 RepID=A0A3M7R638_BRAPC|nr:hypothetical protein BpHYR1_014315 [Brachionus plicatilis]
MNNEFCELFGNETKIEILILDGQYVILVGKELGFLLFIIVFGAQRSPPHRKKYFLQKRVFLTQSKQGLRTYYLRGRKSIVQFAEISHIISRL